MNIYIHLKTLRRRYGNNGVQPQLRKALAKAADEYPQWKNEDRPYPVTDTCGEVIGWINRG